MKQKIKYFSIDKHPEDKIPAISFLAEDISIPSCSLNNQTAAKIALVGLFSKLIDQLTALRSDIRAGRCEYLHIQDYRSEQPKDFLIPPQGIQVFFDQSLVSKPPYISVPFDKEYTTQLEFKFEEK